MIIPATCVPTFSLAFSDMQVGAHAGTRLLYDDDRMTAQVLYLLVCRVALGYAIRTKGRANYTVERQFGNTMQQVPTNQCTAMDPGEPKHRHASPHLSLTE